MELMRCERVDESEHLVRYIVEVAQKDLEEPIQLAYRFLYKDTGINVRENDDPQGHLVELLGADAITGYLGHFIQQYCAGYISEREGIYPYGAPLIIDITEGENADKGVLALSIEFRKTPRYELSSYDPLEVSVSPESDDIDKAASLFETLLRRFKREIIPEDLGPTLDEMTKRFFKELQNKNMSVEQYCKKNSLNDERLHTLIFNEAVESFKENMALDAIFRHHDLASEKCDEWAILTQIEPDYPDALRRQLEETHTLGWLLQAAERQRARRWLMETRIEKA